MWIDFSYILLLVLLRFYTIEKLCNIRMFWTKFV